MVNSTPTRAMVFIDGTFRGLTPFITFGRDPGGLSVGTHHLSVLRAGYEEYVTEILLPESSCHPGTGPSGDFFECHPITIDITLKKVESTQKPTIPTIIPTTAPIQTPIPTHYIYPWKVSPTTAQTPIPSHTPCPPGTPYWICLK
jgi:hypothetical protein